MKNDVLADLKDIVGDRHVLTGDYGMTRETVPWLEAVLADGTVISSMNCYIKNNSGFDFNLMKTPKRALDPDNIQGPGNVVDAAVR